MGKNRLSQDEIRSLLHGFDRATQLAPPENTVDGGWAAETSDATKDGDEARRTHESGPSGTPNAWGGLKDLVNHKK